MTGIPPSPSVPDKELFAAFCEEHLTTMPRVVRSRRVGRDKAKLCVTLESAEIVDDVLESSSLLRTATDHAVRQIYFNRDLTKQQAHEAYNKRCLAREKRLQPSAAAAAAHTASLNPQASPFRVDDK